MLVNQEISLAPSTLEEALFISKQKHSFYQNGYVVVNGHDLMEALPGAVEPGPITPYWDQLPLDEYMNDKGTYRQRRFGRYNYDFNTKRLSLLENEQRFYQSKGINHLNGGVDRQLPQVALAFAHSTFLHYLVNYCLSVIPVEQYKGCQLIINTHQFRVNTHAHQVGLPTPEGIHRDGHHFVSQHLIQRENILGGVSGIYGNEHTPIEHKQLNGFLDSIIVDDEMVKHDVSPLFPIKNDQPSYRDMLIIDYNFIK